MPAFCTAKHRNLRCMLPAWQSSVHLRQIPMSSRRFATISKAGFISFLSFERKLALAPIQLDHPVWVHDDNLDLDYHFRHVSLPKPGTREQLETLVARLHMILLDRTRPLWQYYVIEGLEGGGFAIYIKMHHAGIDGGAGMAALPIIFATSPDPEPAPAPSPTTKDSRAPEIFELISELLRQVLHPTAGVLPVVARYRQGDRESGATRYGGSGQPASLASACTENPFQCVAVEPAIIRNLHDLASRSEGGSQADKVQAERRCHDDQRGRTAALSGDSERASRWPTDRSGAGFTAKGRQRRYEQPSHGDAVQPGH